ncbi:hypothetical protein EVAR_51108_1 [Eumeta japonica]|uniref:Uncharacterized protein n=1 Tax=Eumeta variegata TaxID=151549 RepID=A0A4C1Y7H4_EUMVA|nr:hypothetical protein EVAR_51108_1 [Eumeta japonica]
MYTGAFHYSLFGSKDDFRVKVKPATYPAGLSSKNLRLGNWDEILASSDFSQPCVLTSDIDDASAAAAAGGTRRNALDNLLLNARLNTWHYDNKP